MELVWREDGEDREGMPASFWGEGDLSSLEGNGEECVGPRGARIEESSLQDAAPLLVEKLLGLAWASGLRLCVTQAGLELTALPCPEPSVGVPFMPFQDDRGGDS